MYISIPRALAGPDATFSLYILTNLLFQSPGPSQAPTQITVIAATPAIPISIPRALAGPDSARSSLHLGSGTFQSPGPSQAPTSPHSYYTNICSKFQSPGPSQAPTLMNTRLWIISHISIPRALAGPDNRVATIPLGTRVISIPRALAGPD